MNPQLTIAQSPRAASRLEEFKLLDPHDWTDVKEIMSVNIAIFDALVARGPDLSIKPGLATDWSVSSDARVWTFALRDDATFHNGEKFDAHAARFALERMANPPAGAGFDEATIFSRYLRNATIEASPSNNTVTVRLDEPNAELLDILVDGYMVPPQAARSQGASFKEHPIGTGPYKFVEYVPGSYLVAEANEDYFGTPPEIGQIVWRLLPDSRERIEVVRTGSADIAVDIAPKDLELFQTHQGVHSVRLRDTISYIYFFNCTIPPFTDPKVRQAVNYAVDKQGVIGSVLDGYGYVLNGIVGPTHKGHDETLPPYPHDPGKALRLLREAGYQDGFTITIDSPTSLPANALRLSEVISQQLQQVGIQCKIRVTEDRLEYAEKVRRKEIGEMCCFDSTPLSSYRVLQEKISSESKGPWWQGYHNEQVNELIELISLTIDPRSREELYRRCFHLLHSDPPWLFLHNSQNAFAVTTRLKEWRPRLDGCVIPQWITRQSE